MKILSVLPHQPIQVRKKISNVWRGGQITTRINGITVTSGDWITINRSIDSRDSVVQNFPQFTHIVPESTGTITFIHILDLAAMMSGQLILLDALLGFDGNDFAPEEIHYTISQFCHSYGHPKGGIFVGQSLWMNSKRMALDREIVHARPEAAALPKGYYRGMSREDVTKLGDLLKELAPKVTFRDQTLITGEVFGIEHEFDRLD